MQIKLRSNLLISFLLQGLLLINLAVAQDSLESNPSQEVQAVENHDTKDLEKMLKNYHKDQEKLIDDTTTIHDIQNSGENSEVTDADLEEISPNPFQRKKKERLDIDNKDLKKMKFSEAVRLSLEPLQKMSEAELLVLLKENSKDSKAGPYFEKYPKISLLCVRLIKDKEAIPTFLKIAEDKERLIHFAGWMLGTIILGFILKKAFYKKDRSIMGSIGMYFVRFTIVNLVRSYLIYFYFSKELSPGMKIMTETMF